MDVRGKKVLVVGLGKSGVAAARLVARCGARVTVNDRQRANALRPQLALLADLPLEFKLGGHDEEFATQTDLIVVSPGVSLDLPLLVAARARRVPVISELELALQQLIHHPRVVAVTGTNGKTTTTALIGHLLTAAGKKVCVAGNIGTPLCDCLEKLALEELATVDWLVLELSSFQLEATPSLAVDVGVWLNATPDHLDRHASFAEYVAMKARLFQAIVPGGIGIYNAADPAVAQAVANLSVPASFLPFNAVGKGILEENALVAQRAAEACGADPTFFPAALQSFQPPPHRLAFVRELDGVRYYDDSKGTNVGATVRALLSFDTPVILLAGGVEKGGSYEPLIPVVRHHVKQLIMIGQAAPHMTRALRPHVPLVETDSMAAAVRLARAQAMPGDVVLLSPACASFDLFRSYAERGQAFADAVKGLET